MNKKKIFNDPVYGFVSIPYPLLFDLIEHPYFQRLRRIKQLGLTHYVYPGALHTRFHHALGAMHLTTQAIDVLRSKGVEISEEEAIAVSCAILLHDIGHGPFSHALEHTMVDVHHEELSLKTMQYLNKVFDGKLTMAIEIFQDRYAKRFLHQLVSGQLDMDRMDYLNRDSFFTGVSEGVIGYDRIIKMLAVQNDELLVEEKGIYSIEKFLIARRLMYWQVYLHKTVLVAEQMLIKILQRAKMLAQHGKELKVSESLAFFLYYDETKPITEIDDTLLLEHFGQLDDVDIIAAVKTFTKNEDETLAFLANSLLNRKLFKAELNKEPFERDYIENIRQKLRKTYTEKIDTNSLILMGEETNRAYSFQHDEINILYKNNCTLPMSKASDYGITPQIITKYYLCYPKNIT